MVYVYEKENTNTLLTLNVINKQELLKNVAKPKEEIVDVKAVLENTEIQKETAKKLDKILEYTYTHQLATTIPTMLSVTKIKELQNERQRESGKHNVEYVKEQAMQEVSNLGEDSSNISNLFEKPKFMRNDEQETLTGAQKGTLVHLCLQRLDEKKTYDLEEIKALIENLVNREIITPLEAQNINPYKIVEFTKSNIWKELQTAKKVYKERPFFINIPAKEIYQELLEEEVLVQGIIDLYYINAEDEIVLVDYKTDYVERGKEGELIEKYRTQLELYQKALEETLKRKVDKTYIYSVYLGKEIEIA